MEALLKINTAAALSHEQEQKFIQWGNMGLLISEKENALSLRTQAVLAKLIVPIVIDDVPKAEVAMKEVKRELSLLKEERILITNGFNPPIDRLMAPEKSTETPLEIVRKVCIDLKEKHEAAEKRANQKKDEARSIRERILSALASAKAEFSQWVLSRVNIAYKLALQTDVKPEGIGAFLNHENGKVHADMFTKPFPHLPFAHHTQQEIDAMLRELWIIDSNSYVNQFREDLDQKFSDYSIAYNNKAMAIQQAAEQEAKKQQEIESTKQNEQTSVKLEAAAVISEPMGVGMPVKALKKSYEVSMMETLDNSIFIMGAFVANIDKIKPMLGKISKWNSFSILQMRNYLGKLASEDDNFHIVGITFKEVSKL